MTESAALPEACRSLPPHKEFGCHKADDPLSWRKQLLLRPTAVRAHELYCIQLYGKISELAMAVNRESGLMTANEAASVTGVPLRQVHRIIDAGLLGGAVKRRHHSRMLTRNALVGLKLAHDTADVLTL